MVDDEILCKLTRQDLTTHKGFQWVPGEWVETSGDDNLCGPGWLHAYTHPLLAVLLNPIHAYLKDPCLFAIEVGGVRENDNGLKVGFTRMRLMHELELPVLTPEQWIRFGIYCALGVYSDLVFVTWAHRRLSGADRSRAAEAEAGRASAMAASAHAAALETASAQAAAMAAWAAWALDAWAVEAASAQAAAWAVESAVESAPRAPLDLITLAKRAVATA